jgi:hypothetical protein
MAANAWHMAENSTAPSRAPSNTGNPRVTVAFPFSKIEIREPEPALADLAALVRDLTEYIVAMPADRSADQAEAGEELVDRATRLASGLGAK